MTRIRAILIAVGAALLITIPVGSQPPQPRVRPSNSAPATAAPKNAPRLVPVAENKLLMEGMTYANFLGLEKVLKSTEVDNETWGFARGQAILIAESGNLLMIRPPNNPNQDTWMKAAGEMRDSASQLAKLVAAHDLPRSRTALVELSRKCNACHQSFRVETRIKPFAAGSE